MLTLATEAQKLERDRLTHDAWGQALTVDGYVERESRLRAHPWAREGMLTWVLTGSSGEVLSSCETFRMDSYARLASPSEPSRASSYAIASVYTEAALRGRGYAARMMSLVAPRVRAMDPSAHALVLYSDVGARIYERSGYVARPTLDRVFEPLEGDASEDVELVTETSMPRSLSLMPRPTSDFLIWPTASQIDWHLERERAYSSILRRPRPSACGARRGGSAIVWAAGFKTDELNVLLLHAESPSDLSSLLRSARRTASVAGLRRVVCWDHPMSIEWPAGPDGGSLCERGGSMPMICPLDPRVSPASWVFIPKALWV